ncbi:MAG: IS982 family transposase [Bacteroidia bacterium]
MLQEYLIAIYCLVDDLLKAKGHKFDKRAKINDSELKSIAVFAAQYCGGNWQQAYQFFLSFSLVTVQVHKSRISRRLHSLSDTTDDIINEIGNFFIDILSEKEFIIDSAPVSVCDNIRIKRCRLLLGEDFRGYVASFRRYFYGVRLQLVTTKQGIPVRYALTEGALADSAALALLQLDMSRESKIYLDAAYTDYKFEDQLKRKAKISLLVQRKKNTKRKRSRKTEALIKKYRKRIETTFSMIKARMPRKIHAVTVDTFLLKIKFFILAAQFQMIF